MSYNRWDSMGVGWEILRDKLTLDFVMDNIILLSSKSLNFKRCLRKI